MHLWPSMTLRDSFKIAYLKKLELNLHLMKLDKKKRQQDSQAGTSDGNDYEEKLLKSDTEDPSKRGGKFITIWRELLLIISCCYCCFGCGAFVNDEGN